MVAKFAGCIFLSLIFFLLHNISLDALAEDCISYDTKTKTISITCGSADLSKVYNTINNTSVLKKDQDNVWLLNANLKVWHDATLYINSTDTSWLKINSTTPRDAYRIFVIGDLRIDSVKVSSWNTTSGQYALTDGKIPRASIVILPQGSGKTNIINSEIAYLGDGNVSRGQGISFWSGDGSVIRNNTIHHMYYGFYSERVGGITIENNTVHSDIKYGIDPHTGTHDLLISGNRVHGNGHIGIICSLNCKNIKIIGNIVYNNTNAGIMLSKNVQNSTVYDNKITNEPVGISVSESVGDKVHSNTMSDNDYGIQIKLGSYNNTINSNSINNAAKCGVQLSENVSRNVVVSNTVVNSSKFGICLVGGPTKNLVHNNTIDAGGGYAVYAKDSNSADNVFKQNKLMNVARTPVKLLNSTVTFINNTIGSH